MQETILKIPLAPCIGVDKNLGDRQYFTDFHHFPAVILLIFFRRFLLPTRSWIKLKIFQGLFTITIKNYYSTVYRRSPQYTFNLGDITQEGNPVICTPWVPIHLSFNRSAGAASLCLSGNTGLQHGLDNNLASSLSDLWIWNLKKAKELATTVGILSI